MKWIKTILAAVLVISVTTPAIAGSDAYGWHYSCTPGNDKGLMRQCTMQKEKVKIVYAGTQSIIFIIDAATASNDDAEVTIKNGAVFSIPMPIYSERLLSEYGVSIISALNKGKDVSIIYKTKDGDKMNQTIDAKDFSTALTELDLRLQDKNFL